MLYYFRKFKLSLANSPVLQIDNRMNTHGQSGDITSWLSSLQLAGTQEEDDQPSTPGSLDSYDIVGNRAHSVRTSECSSIEIVPSHYDSEKVGNIFVCIFIFLQYYFVPNFLLCVFYFCMTKLDWFTGMFWYKFIFCLLN